MEGLVEMSDMPNFGLMSDVEKQFSVPYSIRVCYESDRILGVQLGLQMDEKMHATQPKHVPLDLWEAYKLAVKNTV